jgi:hypothetical protein
MHQLHPVEHHHAGKAGGRSAQHMRSTGAEATSFAVLLAKDQADESVHSPLKPHDLGGSRLTRPPGARDAGLSGLLQHLLSVLGTAVEQGTSSPQAGQAAAGASIAADSPLSGPGFCGGAPSPPDTAVSTSLQEQARSFPGQVRLNLQGGNGCNQGGNPVGENPSLVLQASPDPQQTEMDQAGQLAAIPAAFIRLAIPSDVYTEAPTRPESVKPGLSPAGVRGTDETHRDTAGPAAVRADLKSDKPVEAQTILLAEETGIIEPAPHQVQSADLEALPVTSQVTPGRSDGRCTLPRVQVNPPADDQAAPRSQSAVVGATPSANTNAGSDSTSQLARAKSDDAATLPRTPQESFSAKLQGGAPSQGGVAELHGAPLPAMVSSRAANSLPLTSQAPEKGLAQWEAVAFGVAASATHQQVAAELRVALRTEVLGAVQLRAVLNGEQLGAAINVESTEGHRLLATGLPALHQALADHSVRAAEISITSGAEGQSAGSEGRSGSGSGYTPGRDLHPAWCQAEAERSNELVKLPSWAADDLFTGRLSVRA